MAKVIVPKNCVYNYTKYVSGITASNIVGSTYTINYQLIPEDRIDNDVLGFNITIDYGMSSSTASVDWTSSTLKYITIKNSLSFGCNFIILTVNNLPKIKNTGSVPGALTIRLGLSDNTYIDLFSPGVKPGETLTISNATYYVDLVNNTATTNANNLTYNYNKAVIYNDSYWKASKELYDINYNSNSYTITPKNPFPYIFNDIEFRWPDNALPIDIDSPTDVIINIDTSNNPSYIFLFLNNLPDFKNTSSFDVLPVKLYIKISEVKILIDSININSGLVGALGLSFHNIFIDVINKELIYKNVSFSDPILQKAIIHL